MYTKFSTSTSNLLGIKERLFRNWYRLLNFYQSSDVNVDTDMPNSNEEYQPSA